MTPGIQPQVFIEEFFYLNCRNSIDTKLKEHYKLYCKIVSEVAKKLHYDKIVVNSKIEIKTTWNIINSETGKKQA
jgi:hypothetical protein